MFFGNCIIFIVVVLCIIIKYTSFLKLSSLLYLSIFLTTFFFRVHLDIQVGEHAIDYANVAQVKYAIYALFVVNSAGHESFV